MKIFNSIVIFFYTLVFLLVGSLVITYASGHITPEMINELIRSLPTDLNFRMIIGLTGIAIIIISLSVLQLALGSFQQKKTLTYNNVEGQVTVTFSAIEDFIRRVAKDFKEIRELRPIITTAKKVVNISCKTILYQGASIPEITKNIQTTVREKVQGLLGVEEELNIKIHVIRIISREKVSKEKKEYTPEAPFQYRSKV